MKFHLHSLVPHDSRDGAAKDGRERVDRRANFFDESMIQVVRQPPSPVCPTELKGGDENFLTLDIPPSLGCQIVFVLILYE